MKLLLKQRFFSWLDSYDIYAEDGSVAYSVRSRLAWGHCFKVYDRFGNEVGMVKQRIMTLLPKFEIYLGNSYAGCISRRFSILTPQYDIDYMQWSAEGDFFGWDYRIVDRSGRHIANIEKQLFNWTDTYMIDVPDPANALSALMLVLAIDAEKCTAESASH